MTDPMDGRAADGPADDPQAEFEGDPADAASTATEADEADLAEAEERYIDTLAEAEDETEAGELPDLGRDEIADRPRLSAAERRAQRLARGSGTALPVDPSLRIRDRASTLFVAASIVFFVGVFANAIFLGHGGLFAPLPTPTPVPSLTPTPSLTPSPTPTAAPSATPTAAPSATPTAAPSATPTAAPSATPTAEPSATQAPSAS
jgi:hypothetical protein